jgi:methylthioribose-1-phosphate isomerase
MTDLKPMEWQADGPCLRLLDQRLLPAEERWIEVRSRAQAAEAISSMAVRGAPAIGMAAAYGMALAAFSGEDLGEADAELRGARPTAVNLAAALDRLRGLTAPEDILAEAQTIEADERAMNLAIAEAGASLLPAGAHVLTICNTGAIATAGVGTALGIIRAGWSKGLIRHVWACETRPRLQGARLTAWELMQEEIPFSLIADSAAAFLMAQGRVSVVIAGADRIAANGDSANKIGTYMLAVAAHRHGIPFWIAAPRSTIDPASPTGDGFVIEERAPEEITQFDGCLLAPTGAPAYNPAFDVTPGSLISAIITESGAHTGPYEFGGMAPSGQGKSALGIPG